MKILSDDDMPPTAMTFGCSNEELGSRRCKLDVRELAIFATVLSTFAAMFVGFIELLRYLWRLI